jgi:RNA polymerase sigma-70 factor, ECF subfamily
MGQTTVSAALPASRTAHLDFEALMRAHRRELLVHCYRMLGSWTDAEDCVQEVSLRAWRGLGRFEGRSSARAWLYRIATNQCLTARRRRRSLPEVEVPAAPLGAAPAPPIEEARWVEPMPVHAEAAASAREDVSLAFLVALQRLAPRQRAALLLRDVVGYETSEVAQILGTTPTAVHSALARARARMGGSHEDETPVAPPDQGQQRILKQYVAAWEAGDVKALVALFSRDAIVSMPPYRTWYRGRAAIARWLAERVLAGGRAFRFFPTRANGPNAFALYKSGAPCLPGETSHEAFEPHCIQLVWVEGGRVCRVVSFLSPRLVRAFGFGPRPPRKK